MQATRAIRTLGDARANLELMRQAQDAHSFRRAFEACLANIRTTGQRLHREAMRHYRGQPGKAGLSAFEAWWKRENLSNPKDPLMLWTVTARDAAIHEGPSPLGHVTQINYLKPRDLQPGPPGAGLVINGDGFWWVENRGTPQETRTPAIPHGEARASYSTQTFVNDPPDTHGGKPLQEKNPAALCDLAIQFWAGKIEQVQTQAWLQEV